MAILMSESISKSEFKAHALAVLRNIEETGEPRTITDRGKPTLEIRKLRVEERSPLDKLRTSVVAFEAPTEPVAETDWEALS